MDTVDQVTPLDVPASAAFWAIWVVACMLGWVLGDLMSIVVTYTAHTFIIPGTLGYHLGGRIVFFLLILVIGSTGNGVSASIFGSTQQVTLVWHSSKVKSWVPATALAGVIGYLPRFMPIAIQIVALRSPPPIISPAIDWLVYTTVTGVVFGMGQWLVLRRDSPRASWWIPASAVAFLGAGLGSRFVFAGTSLPGVRLSGGLLLITLVEAIGVSRWIRGAIIGALSGPVLLWILRTRTLATPIRETTLT